MKRRGGWEESPSMLPYYPRYSAYGQQTCWQAEENQKKDPGVEQKRRNDEARF